MSDSSYGLSGLRDKDGNRQTVEHSYEWGGDEITIKLDPPTVSQQEAYEDLGEEAGAGELRDVLDEHLVEPSIPDDEEWTMRELLCYVNGIVDFSNGGAPDVIDEVRDELDQRADGAGN